MVKRLAIMLTMFLGVMATAGVVRAASVTASVDRTRVAGGERLNLTVTIEGGKGDVNVDGIRDFQVISRGTSSSYNIINGEVSSTVQYTYTLVPLKKGPLVIPALPVTVGKKTLYTKMIPIEVSDSPSADSGPKDADVFVRLSVSDDAPWLGEQITCRLHLYNAVRITNAGLTLAPKFPGFSAEQLEDNRSYSRVVGGRQFDVTEIVYVLTPEQAGEHSIGPAVISCDVVSRKSSRGRSTFDSFFNDPFFGGGLNLERRRLTAAPVTVNVRPLPAYNGKESFSGLVGEFAVSAEMDQTTIDEGDSVNLAVIVSGRGNIQSASSPGFHLPDAFKVYEDAPVEDIAVSDAGVSGKKRFPAALVALTPGTYSVGPFSLTYFDVSRESYITISTPPIDITVNPSDHHPPVDGDGAGEGKQEHLPRPVKKKAVEFTGHDIFPVKQDLSALEHQGPIPLNIFFLLTGAPFLLYGIAVVIISRVRRKVDDATLMSRKSRAALASAGREKTTLEARLDLLFKAVVYAVYARAGRRGESLTYREARQMLRENGCEASVADETCRLLSEIEQARYGGRSVDTVFFEKVRTSTGALIRRILP